jgi:hypothetical protein
MRTKQLFGILICMLFIPQIVNAQFTNLGFNYGQTTNPMRGIGIGDFSGGGAISTSARLHVNNFFCTNTSNKLVRTT